MDPSFPRCGVAEHSERFPPVHHCGNIAIVSPPVKSGASSPLDDVFEIQFKGRGAGTAKLRKFARAAVSI
jgi:hypothetical protein